MRNRFGVGIFSAAVLALSALPAHAVTVDEIVAKHIDALGGAARLHAIRTLRLSGKQVGGGGRGGGRGGGGAELAWGSVRKRPGMIREERTTQGLTAVEVFDGREVWSFEPFGGRREAQHRSADDLRGLIHSADIDDALVDWKQKGHRVDYLGTEDVDGTPAHKLRVTLKDGDVQNIYLDPDAFLIIRIVSTTHIRGVERTSETDYGNYEQVSGVWIPFSIESGQRGGARGLRITVEHAEANVEVSDADFRFPTAGQAVARTIPPPPPGAGTRTASTPPPRTGGSEARPVLDSGVISGLRARNIGSATMSGRIAAVAGKNEGGRTLLFVGAASGGVWKSIDGGTTFRPVFDKMPVQSIGAITIDPSNSKTVWVGTGESWMRNSVSVGDGVYKSTDGGENWMNVGLPNSEHIARILVNPKNSDTVYVCATGRAFSDSSERGVYKSTDGGKTWALVLKGANLSTGCSSLAMDPKNPEALFAGMWDFRRKGWTFRSGGENADAQSGSGMFRTADGGKSWQPVSAQSAKGLPRGPWGRVEVVIAPSDANIVYALIESKNSALYRSNDGGATWEARDRSQNTVWRAFYFARLVVDPTRPDRLFKPDLVLTVSDDGGKTFSDTVGRGHGDWHDLWINPDNPKQVVGGDDGGLWLSYDGGNRWWKSHNLPISQFYHVAVDKKDPYQVYGGLQDNSSWAGDSAYPGGISNARWENLYGGDGFWAVVDPTDPDAVYAESQGGNVGRVDRRTLATREIQPQARYKEKLRWNWNTPIYASPTQKGTIYIGSQFLFRSKDRGYTWDRISPDLTTNDPEKQKQEESGGVTVDNSSAETHTTVYSISESPLDAKVIWVGTDDGNVQLSRDAGKSWTNVVGNVPGLPKSSWVSWVEASRFKAGTAFATFDRHTFGDMTPWVYRTTDFGKTWHRIVTPDQGVRGYAHVIKEDLVTPSLLFVGTEFGLWISIDGGEKWAEFKGGNFPSVAVRDLQVHPRENDLVLATHGRGIWIVDDITPLRNLSQDVLAKSSTFLPTRATQQRMPANGGWRDGDAGFEGENPPTDAVITYYQRTRHIYGPLKLEVFDAGGKLIDTLTASKRRGINRVDWSMRVKGPRVPRAATVAGAAQRGPRVVPGLYTVRLTNGPDVIESKLKIGVDARAPYNVAERKAQFDAVMRAHALFGEMTDLSDRLDTARAAAMARAKALKPGDDLLPKLRSLGGRLDDLKKKIVATKEGGAITGEERIREHLDHIYGALMRWEGRPAKYQIERIDALRHELDDVGHEFSGIAQNDLPPLDQELKRRNLDPIPTKLASVENPDAASDLRLAVVCAASEGTECTSARATVATDEED